MDLTYLGTYTNVASSCKEQPTRVKHFTVHATLVDFESAFDFPFAGHMEL